MLTASLEEKAKNTFEIFSPNEIELINNLSSDPEIQHLFKVLITLFNNSMHNKEIGWLTKILQNVSAEDKNAKTSPIYLSAKRYLETAAKLQKPKEGMVERLTLPTSGKVFEKHVNVYETFWQDCEEAVIHNYLANIANKIGDELDEDRAKAYLYTILQFKDITLDSLTISAEKILKLKTNVEKVAKGVVEKCQLKTTFQLTELQKLQAMAFSKKVLEQRTQLLALKKAFEINPIYAHYIHFPPSILVQYAQLLDYVNTRINAICKYNFSFFTAKSRKDKMNQLLQILHTKHYEVKQVLRFHQSLYSTFSKDDFIENLCMLVNNREVNLLPIKGFFDFANKFSFTVADFQSNDLLAPKMIKSELISKWRDEYLSTFEEKLTILPPNQSVSPKSSSRDMYNILPISFFHFVFELKPLVVAIPTEIISVLTALDIKNIESIPIKSDLTDKKGDQGNFIFDYFVKDAAARKDFFSINRYTKLVDFFHRQIIGHGKILFFSPHSLPGEALCLTKSSIIYMEGLIAALKISNLSYAKELTSAESVLGKIQNKVQKKIFATYVQLIREVSSQCNKVFTQILNLWLEQITDYPARLYPPIKPMTDLIYLAITLLKDKNLLNKYNKITKFSIALEYETINPRNVKGGF